MKNTLFVLALGLHGLSSAGGHPSQGRSVQSTQKLFSNPDWALPEAPPENQLTLGSHPNPNVLASPARSRIYAIQEDAKAEARKTRRNLYPRDLPSRASIPAETSVGTLYSGVYPVVNVTWANKANASSPSQSFVSFIDTGSSDTFAVSNRFQCVGEQNQTAGTNDVFEIAAGQNLTQASCNFGKLYDVAAGDFTNLTDQAFSISYFPEMESLTGSMVLAPITVGGLTVPQQQVAIVEEAAWTGDGVASGLLGLGFPSLTAARNRSTGAPAAPYSPFFTSLYRQQRSGPSGGNLNFSGAFSLAVNRVPYGTPYWEDAGVLALGGLVSSSYYEGSFTTVSIEPPWSMPATSTYRAFYATTVRVLYGPPGATVNTTAGHYNTTNGLVQSPLFQGIVDSGTAPNFVPTTQAAAINALFDPPAVLNKTLNYYTVDCNAKVPYVAFVLNPDHTGIANRGQVMPMDPRDMIVRSLNGLPGYDDVCFSSFADGGSQYTDTQVIGATWQHSYVVAYDQGGNMLHVAKRKPY